MVENFEVGLYVGIMVLLVLIVTKKFAPSFSI